jgi:hypothetical protein
VLYLFDDNVSVHCSFLHTHHYPYIPKNKRGRGNAQWGSNYSPEERPYLRHALATKRKHKVRVTDDFSDGPGNQHGRVGERVLCRFGERVCDAPDEEESACDLHQGCEDRGADEACVGVREVFLVE